MASVECLPRSYLRDAARSAEAIHEMFPSLKFNIKQCTYLCDKLCVVIDSAKFFLEESEINEVGTSSRGDNTDYGKTFELLVVLGKQIESFVKGCCETKWIQAAMVLTNTSEYVSSLGFNMNLCKVAFRNDQAAFKCHTMDEVDGMKKCDVEEVKARASMDAEDLIEKVTLALNELQGEDRDLASYLLQRLLEIKRAPSSGSGTYLSDLFAWLKSGKQVGRGASATVYKAKWLGIRVAMKTFEGFKNVEFDKEVKTLARLCHPNITSMFCCTKNKRNCSIIMELMDGDLGQLINKRWHDNDGDWRPFPIVEAVDIMLQIGEGVNYLHNEGIVHRDLKSGNILYKGMKVKNVATEYVHVKVADFGISKARDANTTYSDLTCNTGTNRWMPPEVIRLSDKNQGIMRSSTIRVPRYPFKLDTYSFGLVCYEILSGNVPFWEWGNPIEVKKRILKKERPRLPSECPLMLKALIEKCWSHEPESRPTFGEICRELTYIKYSLMTCGLVNQHVDDSRTRENIADGKVAIHDKGSTRSVGSTARSWGWGWGKGRAGGGRPVLRSEPLSLLGEPLVDIRQTYTFKHELGRGEMGVTYLCTHNETGEELACKSIAKQKLTSEDVEDLKREVQIMHHLSGTPNIVEMKGVYEDKHSVHLVMELCTGGELFDDIIAIGHYSEKAAAKLCRVIVSVVQKLHSLGVFHRDLRPENFLLATKTKDATLKVRGFGLATFFKHGELFREIVGTPYYMAPEVLKSCYGPEADVWSAGVILYILLCGVQPFRYISYINRIKSEQEIAQAILRGTIAFQFDPWPKISCGAKDLVTRMLNPDREARLTAQQVLDHPWMEAYCDDASDEPPDDVMLTRLIDFSEAMKRKLLQQNLWRKEASEEARLLHHVTKT